MNLVSVDKFLPRVLPFAENLPEIVARRCVSDACRDLMDEALNVVLTYRFQTHEGEARYRMALPYRMQCIQARGGSVKDKAGDSTRWQITPTTAEALDSYSYPVSWREAKGTPRAYLYRAPDEILLVPIPDRDGMEVSLECACTIRRDAMEVPEVLYEDYADVIASGALAKALNMAGQTWSDVQLGAAYAQAFSVGVHKARLEASKNYTKVGGQVIYNRWI